MVLLSTPAVYKWDLPNANSSSALLRFFVNIGKVITKVGSQLCQTIYEVDWAFLNTKGN